MHSRPFCRIFGTRYVDDGTGKMIDAGGEYTFYSDGRFFADVAIPLTRAREYLYLHGSRQFYCDLGNIPAYLCFPVENGKDRLLCFAQAAFHTYPGRETQYRQILLFDRNEIEQKDCYIQDVLNFRFRTEKEIMLMADRVVPESEVFVTKQYGPIDYLTISEKRRVFICNVMHSLMNGEKIAIRFPVSSHIKEEIDTFLVQLFWLIPNKDRCAVSFSTMRTEIDIQGLDNISMIIVDANTAINDRRRQVLDLDCAEQTPEIRELLLFSREQDEDRKEADEEFSGIPAKDLQTIKQIYIPEAWWWNESEPDPQLFFTSITSVEEFVDKYPSFSLPSVRERFCKRLPGLMNYDGGIVEAVLDALFYEKGKKKIPLGRYQSVRRKLMGFGVMVDVTEQCRMYQSCIETLSKIDGIIDSSKGIEKRIASFSNNRQY